MLNVYMCPVCHNIVVKIKDGKMPMECCGMEMELLVPKTADMATEKHVPVVEIKDGKAYVKVGSTPHPMEDEHFINFVILEKEDGFEVKYLRPDQEPVAVFNVGDEKVIAAYEYCTLHGFWKNEL